MYEKVRLRHNNCGGTVAIVDSRLVEEYDGKYRIISDYNLPKEFNKPLKRRRKYKCSKCDKIFYTMETIENVHLLIDEV